MMKGRKERDWKKAGLISGDPVIFENPEFSNLSPTPESLYIKRKQFLSGSLYTALAATVGHRMTSLLTGWDSSSPGMNGLQAAPVSNGTGARTGSFPGYGGQSVHFSVNQTLSTDESRTDSQQAKNYVNFYEFGTDKESPVELAHKMNTHPWELEVTGLVKRKQYFTVEFLMKKFALEQRTYRHRCVEGWSMVIPWIGIPLHKFIDLVHPGPNAKYMAFETLADPQVMPNVGTDLLDWPYTEALRLDEARNKLTFLTFGMYGQVLPPQNGAPIRLVVPWKYGFKSIKSIKTIRFTGEMPTTTWMRSAPEAYGFYANVNPDVPHPSWSQKTERRIGDFLRQKTLRFNGYEDYVGHLYEGMDLRKHF